LHAGVDAERLRIAVSARLREQFGIRHNTLQCEFTPCDSGDDCSLAGESGSGANHTTHAHEEGHQHSH